MAPAFPVHKARLISMAFEKDFRPKTSVKKDRVSFTENFREYCLNTTIHGLKYVGTVSLTLWERDLKQQHRKANHIDHTLISDSIYIRAYSKADRSFAKMNPSRIYFFLTFIVVTACAVYFISNVYLKWQSSPIIIGLNPIATNIKDIPFPAVTICNMNQVRREAADRIEAHTLEQTVLQAICSIDGDINVTQYEGKWSAVKQLLLSATQPCSRLLKACRYAKQVEKCTEIFQSVLTDEGLCCTFNTLDATFMFRGTDALNIFPPEAGPDAERFRPILWTPEGGFAERPTNRTYPRVIPGPGVAMGLAMVLDANVSDYYCSSTSSTGFKIIFHSPSETPKITDYAQYIPVGSETRIIITPKINDAASQIRKVSQEQRQCVFANEANLSYYSVYSRNNCELECEAKLILENCGCVLYFLPKLYEDTKICSRANARCYEQIRNSIAFTANTSLTCSCLPGCFEISYVPDLTTAELHVGQFGIRETMLGDVKDEKYAKENLALVYVFVKDTYFRSFTKGELVGFTDFLSNVGGLLGLFLGFSIISLIEVIYFVTLRPYCARRQQRSVNNGVDAESYPGNAARRDLITFGFKPEVQFVGRSTDMGYDQSGIQRGITNNGTVTELTAKLKNIAHSRMRQAGDWIHSTFRLRKNQHGLEPPNRATTIYPFCD